MEPNIGLWAFYSIAAVLVLVAYVRFFSLDDATAAFRWFRERGYGWGVAVVGFAAVVALAVLLDVLG